MTGSRIAYAAHSFTLRLLRAYAAGVVALIVTLILLDIPGYVYVLNPAILPRDWFLAMLLMALPLFVIESDAVSKSVSSPFGIWCLCFVAINAVHIVGGDQEVATVATTRAQLGLLAIFLGAVLQVHLAAGLRRIFLVLAVAASLFVLADLVLPDVIVPIQTEGYVLGRAAGPYINPNKAGEAILLAVLLSVPVVGRGYRTLLLFVACVAIVATFSRASIMGWALLALLGSVVRTFSRHAVLLPVVLVVSWGLLGDLLLNHVFPLLGLEAGSANFVERIDYLFLFQFVDQSADERSAVLMQALELFGNHPIVGGGPGATFPFVGPHNQTALMAAEYGLPGLALWVWLLGLVATGAFFEKPAEKWLALMMIIFLSLFSHNLLDNPFWLLAFTILSSRRRSMLS